MMPTWKSSALALVLAVLAATVSAETLRVGRVASAPSLGNPFTSVGQPSSGIWSAVYDGLTVIDERGQLQPALALSWSAVEPTRWVFRLRPNVVYHNGAPFTASSVVDVMAYLKTDEGKRTYIGGEASGIVSTRAIDPLTVEFVTAKPDPLLAKKMNLIYLPEPKALATQGMDAFSKAPIGTGAFKFVSWGNGNARNVFDADSKSWRAPKSITRLELLAISDASARLQALMAGQIDVMEGIGRDEIPALDPMAFDVITQDAPAVITLAFRNVGNPSAPVQDKRVRQALSLAINRAALAEAILGDKARAATQGTVSNAVGYNASLSLPYDPAKAKALLNEAGHPKGFPLEIEVITGFGGADRLIYQQVAQDLSNIGVKVELRSIPFPNWLQKYSGGEWGAVDVFSFVWDATMYYDPIRPIRNSSCAKTNPFFCLPDVMPLIESSDTEMDEGKRAEKMRSLMARLSDDATALWIVTSTVSVAAAKRFGSLVWRSAGLAYEHVEVGPP
jgi:peptide/nickel transport system substrate-binding protein